MADTVTKTYVYPPKWNEGNYDVAQEGHRCYKVHLTCVSDGTGETSVSKVALANFQTSNGDAATKFAIDKIECVNYGFTSIVLAYDRAPAITIATIGDSKDVVFEGGFMDDGADQTGDILLTTNGAGAGDSYDITITFRVKA